MDTPPVTPSMRTGIGRGARDGRPDDADDVIMDDPEGNGFWVIDSAEWDGGERRGDTVTG